MDRIQLRRDSSARWAEVNPILLEGEVGYETDTRLRKIGDGVHRWNDLEYLRAEGITQDVGNSDNLVMSQKATTEKLSELGQEVEFQKSRTAYSIGGEKSDLDITDEEGNVIARFSDGGIQTKDFDSKETVKKSDLAKLEDSLKEELQSPIETFNGNQDLDITDEEGNVLVRFSQGGIKTKNFDSERLLKDLTEKESIGKYHIISEENIFNVLSNKKISKIYGRNRFDLSSVNIKNNTSTNGVVITKEDNGIFLDGSNMPSDRYGSNAYAYFDYTVEFTGVLYIGCVSHPVDTFGVTSRLNVEDRDNSFSPSVNCRGIGHLKTKIEVTQGQRLRISFYAHQNGTQSQTSAKYTNIMIAYYDYDDYVPYEDDSVNDVVQGCIVELESEGIVKYMHKKIKPKKKKLVCFGDSITGLFGYGTSYPEIIAKSTDVEAVNCGFSGSTACDHNSTNYIPFSLNRLADAIVSGDYSTQDNKVGAIDSDWYAEHLLNLKGIDWMSVNYISVLIGTNDWAFGKTINSKDDASLSNKQRTNIEDAIKYFIEKVTLKYPHIQSVIVSPPSRYNYSGGNDSNTMPNEAGAYLREVVEMEKEIAKFYNLPFINLYDGLSCNVINRSFILYDGTHPSDSTRRAIASTITSVINNLR